MVGISAVSLFNSLLYRVNKRGQKYNAAANDNIHNRTPEGITADSITAVTAVDRKSVV